MTWEDAGHFYALPICLMIYLLFAAIFLLNTLIAMMALTFERIHDNQTHEFQLQFAKQVVYWGEVGAPSPLNVLSLPYEGFRRLGAMLQARRSRRVSAAPERRADGGWWTDGPTGRGSRYRDSADDGSSST